MKIFIDDIREVNDNKWIIFRTYEQFIPFFINNYKIIDLISLDHDMGNNKMTGYEFLNWLESKIFHVEFKNVPNIQIHSQNPVGRINMNKVIKSIEKFMRT